MCAYLPAPRTVQVVGDARYRTYGGVWEGEFSVPAYVAAGRRFSGTLRGKCKREMKEKSTQGSHRS